MARECERDAEEGEDCLGLSEHSELLDSLYQIPLIDKAWLFPSKTGNKMDATVAMHQVNLRHNSKRKYISSLHISREDTNKTECNWSPFPVELTGVSLLVPSNSGKRHIVVRNGETNKKDSTIWTKLEVWSASQLLKEIIVPASVHGSIYDDGWFEGISWSEDESYVAYVAEEAAPNLPVFGKRQNFKEENSESNPYTWKGQGDWQEDWGEAYTGKRRPVIFVANLSNGSVKKVEGIPDDISAGQVVWAPYPQAGNPKLLVFVGWPAIPGNFTTHQKLGIKYCFNRPCALYAIEAPQAERLHDCSCRVWKLTDSISSAFLPRFSLDGKFLVFLSAQQAVKSGAHNATNSLHTIQWPIDESKVSRLDIVEVVSAIQPAGGFPGLYCQTLITSPWLLDKHTLLLSSLWCSTQVILAVDVKSGKVAKITPSEDIGTWTLLSIQDNYVLAARSSFGNPSSLNLGTLSEASCLNGSSGEWNWFDIQNPLLHYPEKVNSILSSIAYDILNIKVSQEHSEGVQDYFQAIFVSSNTLLLDNMGKRPSVVVVHGGPHTMETTSFSRTYAFLVGLGFNVLVVNYRGSLGFGEESLQSLLGNIGFQDVADVLEALDHAIAQGLIDGSKVGVLGGSHGGFLSTHLIGQAPGRFIAAAVRNPVCNISSMIGATDIPDWCYVETFGKACFSAYSDAPSCEDMDKFYRASSIAHISKVKAPTLFLLGAQDRRVPISNGFQYAQALRSRGVKIKVIVFPEDAHPIDRPQSEYESWLNIGAWFKRHLKCV